MMCGKGFGMILVLFWATALSSDLALVSGQTVAPLTSSTSAPPKLEVKPTKPMIVNAPPKKHVPMSPEAPKLNGSKPMQVTGFITKSGNIYEIEDKRGSIGAIEGRQADEGQIVCNYGTVVIYSDVPCDQVRNVRVGEVKPLKEQPSEVSTEKGPAEGEQQEQEQQQQQDVAEDQSQDADQEPAEEQPNHPRGQSQNNRRRRRRPQQQQQRLQQQRRRRQQQQKLQQRRRNGNGNNTVRRRRIRNNNGNHRNRQQQRRRRPNNNNNNNRRRLNNNNGQRQQQRRRQQQQRRRPNSNINRQQQQRRRLRDGNN
ncbi:probable serine/threonine-protein kinase dyrk1 [Drosophila biarmipes]|uniref:probable serine/threonine-protein kinase dyrk1 n=1 Tax=Drosophila biarmipes TaxID=125945 RepID=UPI0007E753E3|nr:probable serine/threonine-protein kinase dyrk1 [Drosophila biarmipes]